MFANHPGRRLPGTAALAAFTLLALPWPNHSASAQQPADAQSSSAIVLIVRDASPGLPLDAVQVIRSVTGQPAVVIARGDANGRVALSASSLAPDDRGVSIALRRIGYAPHVVSAQQLIAHAAEHIADVHDIMLTPRPALLSAISVETSAPNQL